MQISAAAKLWLEYHKCHSKENSIRAFKLVLTQLCEEFPTEDLEEITTKRILSFLNRITEGRSHELDRYFVWLSEKRQGETAGVFTLMIFEITIQQVKVSSTPKPLICLTGLKIVGKYIEKFRYLFSRYRNLVY